MSLNSTSDRQKNAAAAKDARSGKLAKTYVSLLSVFFLSFTFLRSVSVKEEVQDEVEDDEDEDDDEDAWVDLLTICLHRIFWTCTSEPRKKATRRRANGKLKKLYVSHFILFPLFLYSLKCQWWSWWGWRRQWRWWYVSWPSDYTRCILWTCTSETPKKPTRFHAKSKKSYVSSTHVLFIVLIFSQAPSSMTKLMRTMTRMRTRMFKCELTSWPCLLHILMLYKWASEESHAVSCQHDQVVRLSFSIPSIHSLFLYFLKCLCL